MDTPLTIAGRTFRSRLIVGTGKYPSPEMMVAAHAASGAEMVTVAVRRVRLPGRPTDEAQQAILEHIDTNRYMLLPNTAGCYTADDADSHRAAWPRGGPVGVGKVGGHRR